ncbi:MAG: adenylate/guanylate cyclase domain-containing protein [Gammaproteobacteria bacterium]
MPEQSSTDQATSSSRSLAALLQLSPSLARAVLLGIVAILCLALLTLFGAGFRAIEERAGAIGWTLGPDSTVEERITLVVIDEASIAEIGPWPWERSDIARLVTAIDNAGAQLQLHDITYPEARPGDEVLLAAIASSNGVVFAQTPALQNQSSQITTGVMTHSMNGVVCDSASGGLQIPTTGSYVASAGSLSAVPKGHNGPIIDSDGAVRRSPALVCNNGTAYPALSIAAFLQLGNAEQWGGQISSGSSFFGPQATLSLNGYPGLDIPLDEQGAMRVSYAKSPDSFLAVPAIDVINGNIDRDMFDNAWVLVGVTAAGTGDIVPTPYSGAAFGVEIQARLLASLLDVDVPYTPTGAPVILGLLAVVIGLSAFGLASVGDRVAAYGLPVAALIYPLAALAVHAVVLATFNLWIGWTFPALFGFLAASALLLLELARTRFERTRVFGNLNSYLPADVAHQIAFSLPTSSINAHRRDVTLLNADLRNFSAFGEARPPEEIAAVLHYFFTRAAEIIEREGGRVQEYKGDSLLAIWDGADRVSASRALHSAQALQEALNDTLLPEQAISGLEPLALGIGIEQGPVLIGSIGPAHRRTHTLLGDTVGITLRIQEMTAELAQPILVGECAARQLTDESLESQGSYLLSGLRIPHTLFAPRASANARSAGSGSGEVNSQPSLTVVSGGKR